MLDLNLNVLQVGQNKFEFSLGDDAPELIAMLYKHNDLCHVRISQPKSPKTLSQLAAFHPLSMALYLSGMHSAPDQFRQSYSLFRYWLKMEFGPVTWVDYQEAHIPICKSIADYTIKEMSQLLEGLVVMCKESRAYPENPEVKKIIEGMQL